MTDVIFHLDGPCNLTCSYCITGAAPSFPARPLPPRLAEEWLEFVAGLPGERVVRFNGAGEPTLVPGFWDLVEGMAKLARVVLYTNLTFPLERLFAALPPERCAFVLVSLHAHWEQRPDELRRRWGALRDRSYPVWVHYMVDDARVEGARRAQSLGLDPFFLSPVQSRGAPELPRDLAPATRAFLGSELRDLHHQLLLRNRRVVFVGEDCSAGATRLVVRGDRVYRCYNSDRCLGTVRDYQLDDAATPCDALDAWCACLPDQASSTMGCFCQGEPRLCIDRAGMEIALDERRARRPAAIAAARALTRAWGERLRRAAETLPRPRRLVTIGIEAGPLRALLGDAIDDDGDAVLIACSGWTREAGERLAASMSPHPVVLLHDVPRRLDGDGLDDLEIPA